jgi:hydroxymethylpyrimidine/phosphomethylpyrimidine kinase
MVAKSGDKLLRDDAIDALKSELIPLATVITPNIPEAQVLAGKQIATKNDLEQIGTSLLKLGPASVLIKGGHFTGQDSDDCLLVKEGAHVRIHWLAGERIDTPNTHGTGCTLSSAIAAFLAQGYEILDAVRAAKKYTSEAILAGAQYKIGQGHGPVSHFYKLWKD